MVDTSVEAAASSKEYPTRVLKSDKWTISPSQLGTFENCENLWFLKYVLNIKEPSNRHMTRGSALHKAVEDLWKFQTDDWESLRLDATNPSPLPMIKDDSESVVKPVSDFPFALDASNVPELPGVVSKFSQTFRQYAIKIFNQIWVKYREQVTNDLKQFDEMYASTVLAYLRYVDDQILFIEVLVNEKGKSYKEAYSTVRPYRREKKYYSESKLEVGILDAIIRLEHDDMISDYKTSTIWGAGHSEEYLSQLGFYTYLYYENHGKLPGLVEINYILYGIKMRYEASMKMVEQTKQRVSKMRTAMDEVFSKTRQVHKNTEFKWCRTCWMGNQGLCDRKN